MKVPRIWHPLVIGQIPILSLYVGNRLEVEPAEILLPGAVVLGLSAILWLVVALAMRSLTRAALPVSVLLYAFFQFDLLHQLWFNIAMESSATVALVLTIVIAILITVAVAVVLVRIVLRPLWLQRCNSFLNYFSILVIAGLLIGLVREATSSHPSYDFESQAADVAPGGWPAAGTAFETGAPPKKLPDIYYLILDGYGRGDVLREIYGFDNSEFLARLRARGFFVAERSAANYSQTFLSLSSSLNARQHTWLQRGSVPRQALLEALRHNSVLKTLKSLGYRQVSYYSNFRWTDFTECDEYRRPDLPNLASEFPALVIGKTPLHWFSGIGSRALRGRKNVDRYTIQRQQVLFALQDLGEVPRMQGPKFVFAHIFCPHPPFVFNEEGQDTSPRDITYLSSDGSIYLDYYGEHANYHDGYRGQVAFITPRIEATIDAILHNSAEPPVIILQADHGPGWRWNCDSEDPSKTDVKERFGILNAYYLPGVEKPGLYDGITPVNSFRIVFNSYFGSKLPLVPDDSFLSPVSAPFEFVKVSPLPR